VERESTKPSSEWPAPLAIYSCIGLLTTGTCELYEIDYCAAAGYISDEEVRSDTWRAISGFVAHVGANCLSSRVREAGGSIFYS